MATLYKKYFYLLIFLFSLTSFAQTILIENREENDSLWSLGASDLLSFYLEEQGLKMANRDSLSTMTGEVDLAEAKFSKSAIKKGDWYKTDFIITGEVKTVPDKGLFVQISVTNVKNAQVITKQQKQVKDEDQLAVEIEVFARLIGKKIASNANRKLNNEVNETQEKFLDAITLFKFYKAINLITDDKEAEGIRELMYITHNSPNFTIPYYWLASFFRKNNYLKIAESIESIYPSFVNQNKGVHLIYGQSLANNAVQKIQSKIESLGFYTLNPESLLKLDLEKDLQQWRYIKSGQIAHLSSYLSAYTIKLDLDNKQNYHLKIFESTTNQVITEATSSDFNIIIEKLNKLNDPSKIKKFNHNPTKNKPKVTSYTKGNQHEYLAYLIQQLMNKQGTSEDIWRLMSFYRTMHLRGYLWPEILTRSLKQDYPIWDITYRNQRNSIYGSGLIGSSSTHLSYIENSYSPTQTLKVALTKYKDINLSIAFAYAFNSAVELALKKNYQNALTQLNKLQSSTGSFNLTDEINESIHYWKWHCAIKLKNTDLANKYSSYLNQKKKSSWEYSYTAIYPIISYAHISRMNYQSLRFSLTNPVWRPIDINQRWFYYDDDKVEKPQINELQWPKISFNIPLLKDAKSAHDFFKVFQSHIDNDKSIPKDKISRDFTQALFLLSRYPSMGINNKIRDICYQNIDLFSAYEAKQIMIYMGDYKAAAKIIQNLQKPAKHKYDLWRQLWAYEYPHREATRKAAQYIIDSGETFIIDSYLIELCISYFLLDEAEQLIEIDIRAFNKPSDEVEFEWAIFKADIAYYRGDMINALRLYKDLRLGKWTSTTIGKVHDQDAKDYIRRKIRYIESLNPERKYTCSWECTGDGVLTSSHKSGLLSLSPELRKDFMYLFNKVKSFDFNKSAFYTNKSKKKIRPDLQQFIDKHSDKVLPELINFNDFSLSNYNSYINMWIIEILATPKNKKHIIQAFQKNQKFAELAFKLDKTSATEILTQNIWAITSQPDFNFQIIKMIIKYKITNLYPILFDQCYDIRNEITSWFILRSIIKNNKKPEDYKQFINFFKKLAITARTNLNVNSRLLNKYKEMSIILLKNGHKEGLDLLIQLTKSPKKKPYLQEASILKTFNKTTGISVKSIDEIKDMMDLLSWDQDQKKWMKP